MENLTYLNDSDTLELETVGTCTDESHDHVTNGFGGCNKCSCGGYNPATTGGQCNTAVSGNTNGICGHSYSDHKD